MSPAGAFLAVAVFVAGRDALDALPAIRTRRAAIMACALLGGAWALRVVGLHAVLRGGASTERNDWAYAQPASEVAAQPASLAMFRRLREDAIFTHPAPPPQRFPFRGWITSN